MQLQPLYLVVYDESLVEPVLVLGNVPEFVSTYRNDSDFGMLTAGHDLTIERVSKHDTAVGPAQGRIFGREGIELYPLRKCKTRQHRERLADLEKRHRQGAIEVRVSGPVQSTAREWRLGYCVGWRRLRCLDMFGHLGGAKSTAVIAALRSGEARASADCTRAC